MWCKVIHRMTGHWYWVGRHVAFCTKCGNRIENGEVCDVG